MSSRNDTRIEIADQVMLDGRLALFHQKQQWLAIADLHFGFEVSQCAAGNLFPLWGMQTVHERLQELVWDYRPAHLILVGDLVHDRTAAGAFAQLVRELGAMTQVILIAGNHDLHLMKKADVLPFWRTDGFCFHHGHCEIEAPEEIQVIGHHHPAHVVRDGAGLRLRLPAFVQQERCWIMPAFSPWAAGTIWRQDDESRIWLCSPNRIIEMAPA